MIKKTECNELENFADLYIFIWDTAPGGDEDIWALNLYCGRLQFKNEKNFSDSNDESRLFCLLSNFFFGQMTIFRKKHWVE
jgi:hypothetical protein